MKVTMGNHAFYCEADKEYWRQLKETRHLRKHDTVVMKYIPCPPYSNENYWTVDGKMTTRGILTRSFCWHPTGNSGPPILYNKLQGNRALDICSSYGISSREFCVGHNSVDVLELEDWYARIVEVNVNNWGYRDRISVAVERDFTQIDYAGYDSVRFGTKKVEYLFYKNPQSLLQVKNIAFEFQVNQMIVDTLYKEGYRTSLNYSSCDVFSKA